MTFWNTLARNIALALSLVAASTAFAAENYPSRPVRVIVPYSPGGSSDTVARIVSQKLSETLGQQFVIDNRPGAAGSLGREIVAKATPDGYTLLIGDSPHTINPHLLKVPYDPIRDFTPVTMLATTPQVLVVNPAFAAQAQIQTLKEFVAVAAAQPGKLNYGSGGTGGITHLTGELFKLAAHVNIVHVPYKSISIAMTDVMGGQVQLAFPSMPGAVPHVRAGRLRGLAVTGEKRAAALPDVPTFNEGGLAGMNVSNWFGVFAPARLPKDRLARLHAAIIDAENAPDVRAKFIGLSLSGSTMRPDEFVAFLKSDLAKWGDVVKRAGITPE